MAISTEQAWQEMRDKLYRFFRQQGADDALAQDLLQDTFLRIHHGLPSLQDHERLVAWVYRIARNTLVDHARQRSTSQKVLPEALASTPAPPEENYNDTVAAWLLQMVQHLPATYRAAVELAELQGLTQREVSERLGLSLSGAKSRVQRGREKLKEQLQQCCHIALDRRGNVVDYQPQSGCQACCAAGTGVVLSCPL